MKQKKPRASLPPVCALEIIDIDIDGDVFARPIEWDSSSQGEPPRIEIMPSDKGHPAPGLKEQVLARLTEIDNGLFEARIIRRIESSKGRILGILQKTKNGAYLQPTDKKAKHDFEISSTDSLKAEHGDLVLGEILHARGMKRKKVKIVEIIGKSGDVNAISLISIHEAGIQEEFPKNVIAETLSMRVPELGNREDLREVPLVTIDGADARDFDDAVFAEKTHDGFHLIVAIADVAYYVRPETALDREAQRRGNSTYFPDRVVPMLPEALSNDLCSLKPNEDRACLAMHMWIDENGELKRHKVVRGLMRSQARLTYDDVQEAFNTQEHPHLGLINPLYEAYRVLDKARQKRGALELDLPEKQVLIDQNGQMTGIKIRTRYDSHKLIEEFMILANVAAAQSLEQRHAPCVYRIHDRPSADKLDSVREFIDSFGLSLPKGQVVRPAQINQVLSQAKELPYSHLISTVILRSQAQAVYSTDNVGHFGLALKRYAHFTSPIRRYADLLIHRSLIRAYGLGPGGLDEREESRLEEICNAISETERTSMQAERNSIDRFTAAFLSEKIGALFIGRISGVTRFGLFVTLDESGADGLVPIRTLPSDFYVHDERAHALIGRRSGIVFRLGAVVSVRLIEADGITGSTILELSGHERGADLEGISMPAFTPYKDRDRRGRKQGQFKDKKSSKNQKKRGKRTTPKHKRRK